MPALDLHGTTIHYEVDGDPSLPPLFVLHGGLGVDHVVYRRSMQPLTDVRRLVLPDHRGNGRSGRPAPETITMAQLADDVVGLADALGIGAFDVLGHSYGGFIAQELAIRHPDRLASLVLVSTAPGQLGEGEEDDQGPPPPPDLDALRSQPLTSDADLEAGMGEMARWYVHRSDPARLIAAAEGTIHDLATMMRGFEVLAGWSAVDRLPSITCPTLVVAGRHDHFTSQPQSMRIARRIPDATLVTLEDSGHFCWFDEPDEFFAVVGRFLRD